MVTRHREGFWLSDIVEGHLVTKLYVGYTLREAKRLFKLALSEAAS